MISSRARHARARRARHALRPVALVALVALVACKKDRAEPPPSPPHGPAVAAPIDGAPAVTPAPIWYRAVVQAADAEFPFLLRLPAPGSAGMAMLQNGHDQIERAATWAGKALRIEFPVYQTFLHAELGAEGTLRGAYESRSRSWGSATWPLVATPIGKPDLAALATVTTGAPIDLGEPRTVWKIMMAEEGLVRLELEQLAPGDFQATLAFPNGNFSYLAGNGRGDRIVVTAFDGVGAMRMTLDLAADRRSASGDWLAGQHLDWREHLTANRTTQVALTSTQPSPRGTVMKLPQLAGLEGRPVIVELAGSWCSVCRNAAPVLRGLHDANPGLAVVSLLYEFTDDPVANREQAAIFTKTYDIPWKVEAVPGTPEELADLMPPGFEKVNISGFPIALFLGADHKVVAVHAGFPAPGTPAYDEAVAAYRTNTARILGGK